MVGRQISGQFSGKRLCYLLVCNFLFHANCFPMSRQTFKYLAANGMEPDPTSLASAVPLQKRVAFKIMMENPPSKILVMFFHHFLANILH